MYIIKLGLVIILVSKNVYSFSQLNIFFLKIEPQKFVNDIHFNFFWATNIVTSLDKMPFAKI